MSGNQYLEAIAWLASLFAVMSLVNLVVSERFARHWHVFTPTCFVALTAIALTGLGVIHP